MDSRHVNAVLSPATSIWEKKFGQPLTLAKARIVSDRHTSEDFTAFLGISGALDGYVLYGFPISTSTAIGVSIPDHTVEHTTADILLSVLRDIVILFADGAATRLSRQGFPCQISPPLFVEGTGIPFTTRGAKQLWVQFSSGVGPLYIRIGFFREPLRTMTSTLEDRRVSTKHPP